MTDDSSETKDIPENQSSEPHVVVCCPSCKTKFAVEGGLIAAYEVPKFHCSRCDLVFQLTTTNREKQRHQEPQKNTHRWVLADGSEHHGTNPFSQPPPKGSALKTTDFTLGEAAIQGVVEPRPAFTPLEERAGLSLLGLRPSAGPALSSALTRNEAVAQPVQANTDVTSPLNISSDEQPELDPFSLFDAPGAPQQSASTPTKVIESVHTPSDSTPPKTDIKIGNNAAQQLARTKSADTPALEKMAPHRALSQAISVATSKLSVRNQGLVYLSLPILALFSFFCVVTYACTLMPRTMDAVLHTAVPSVLTGKVAQLPPSDLLVQEASIEFEKTQSKELIPVVRGVIHNSSTSAIQDILVEALGFDAQGEVVIRAQAPLRSALTREKISDLPLATVKKFQTSLSGRNSTIDPGERVAFSVALLSDAVIAPQVSYFSARIFSVGTRR